MQDYDYITIDNLQFPISQSWKKIGISVSGGADSALLLYLLTKNCIDCEIHVISQIRCWKTRPWQEHNSLEVFNWIKSKFPEKKFKRHTGFIPPELEWGEKGPTIKDEYGKIKSGDQIILRSHNEYICHKEKIDAWYAAVTRNPDVPISGGVPDRDEGYLPVVFEHMNKIVCHPFINTCKDWIIKQYYNNDILELLECTRSCEGDKIHYPEIFGDLDYKTYIPGQTVPECGKCFWCKEKDWALSCVKE